MKVETDQARDTASPLIVCPVNADNWVVIKDFHFVDNIGEGRKPVRVCSRFITDFASIPRPLWVLAPRWGNYGWAAVVHDYLYWEQDRCREEADEIILEAMKRSGVPLWRRYIIYYAVRLFGWLAWRSNARLKQECPDARRAPNHKKLDPFDYRCRVKAQIGVINGGRSISGTLGYIVLGILLGAAATALLRR